MGLEVTLAEIKDIIKVIRSSENFIKGGILLKRTTEKIISQEGGLISFLVPLMKNGLPLMKNVFIPLAKTVLTSLVVTAALSVADVTIQNSSNLLRNWVCCLIL